MKLAGITTNTFPVKGKFDFHDAEFQTSGGKNGLSAITFMMDQGSFGRAWCRVNEPGGEPREVGFDLPNPKEQQVSVSFRGGLVNVSGRHGVSADFGTIECDYLKISGDVNATTLRVQKLLACSHSLLQAAEIVGGQTDTPVREVTLNDSSVIVRNDLYFLNLNAEDGNRLGHSASSRVQANTVEGVNISGAVLVKADRIIVVNLDAGEVHVKDLKNSAIGRSHCNRFFHEVGIGNLVKSTPKVDSYLLQASNNLAVGETAFGDEVEQETTGMEIS